MPRVLNLLLALLLAVPVLLLASIICALVFVLDKTSPIFVQFRLGYREKPFRLYKIRTMKRSTSENATHLIADEAVTGTGRILRKYKLDELPQILNVLNGTMNFVGPRPGLAKQIDLTAARRKHGVFEVLPGITGFAQVNNIDMSDPERLAKVDAEYVQTRTISLDFGILIKTVAGSGRGDRVRVASADVDDPLATKVHSPSKK